MIQPLNFQNPGYFPQVGASVPPALSNVPNPLALSPDGMFLPSNELAQDGGAAEINALLQGLAQMMNQQPTDPIQQLQQEIQKTEMQLRQAQSQGDEAQVEQLSQRLEQLQAQLQEMTGGGQAAGGDAGAPSGGGGGGPMGGGGGSAPSGGGGGAPVDGGGGGYAPSGGSGGGGAPMDGGGGGYAPSGGAGAAGSGAPPSAADVNAAIDEVANGASAHQAAGAEGPITGDGTNQYDSIIREAAQKYGVDPNLIKSVIKQESSFNPNARSGVGAQGLMQLMPGTAREMGINNPYNPRDNIMGGTKYLSQQLKTFGGDVKLALAAYNAGAGNVKKYGGVPPFKETQNYVSRITSDYSKRTSEAATTRVASASEKPAGSAAGGTSAAAKSTSATA